MRNLLKGVCTVLLQVTSFCSGMNRQNSLWQDPQCIPISSKSEHLTGASNWSLLIDLRIVLKVPLWK